MNLTNRQTVRFFSYLIAIGGVLGIRNLQLMSQLDDAQTSLKYSYIRAAEELSEAADSINTTLEKELYAGTAEMHARLASELWREASNAKAALSQLPTKNLSLNNTYKFLSQVGNFSLAISEKIAKGEEITDEEYKNLEILHEYASDLSQKMWELDSMISAGEISFADEPYTAETDAPDIGEGFESFEEGFDNYPKLIYDGPFSDHILEKEPAMLKNADEVTQNKALEKAIMALNISVAELPNIEEEDGKMPSWRFSDEKSTVSCAVTKNGGYLSYFIKSRIVTEIKLSNDEALSCAEDYLDRLGIRSMNTTYYEVCGNVMTVNFAYSYKDVMIFPDLIKVSVAMDNGDILGFDARGYLVNHTDRAISENIISSVRAQQEISPMLTVKSKQLCIIPTDSSGEVLCYEFNCVASSGRKVLVYINAQTAAEEQILMLFESESGTLTI